MHTGRLRHERARVYWQAALVWGLREVDAETWIATGTVDGREDNGGMLELPPELAEKVAEHVRKIEAAGKFVMPD